MLNDLLRDCIIEANNQYPNLDSVDVIIKAFDKYVQITGAPFELETEEEALELLNQAGRFLVDCMIFNMIEKGVCRMAGIDEDGEMVYQLSVEV